MIGKILIVSFACLGFANASVSHELQNQTKLTLEACKCARWDVHCDTYEESYSIRCYESSFKFLIANYPNENYKVRIVNSGCSAMHSFKQHCYTDGVKGLINDLEAVPLIQAMCADWADDSARCYQAALAEKP